MNRPTLREYLNENGVYILLVLTVLMIVSAMTWEMHTISQIKGYVQSNEQEFQRLQRNHH